MRNTDAAASIRETGPPVPILVALLLVTVTTVGCGSECRAVDPTRALAFEAAARGDVAGMRVLLERNAALARASECVPRSGLIDWLVRRRKMGPTGGASVLHVAARQGYADLARLLLANGAQVDARDPVANTALHLAAQYGHDDVVEVLLRVGANVNARRLGGFTPLHLSASHGSFPVAKYLLSGGADVNAQDDLGWTPLHAAASAGNDNIARLLLAHNANVRAVGREGIRPLDLAIINHHEAVVALLAAKGASVNAANQNTTPLTLAVKSGGIKGVHQVLEAGADVNGRDRNGHTPLELVIQDRGPDEPRKVEDQRIVALLLAAGANVEARGRDGDAPLHKAASLGRADLLALLLAYGADVDARNDWGWTPLHYAANRGQAEVAEMLLEHGADANATSKDGRRPLSRAFANERLKALLLRYGARD